MRNPGLFPVAALLVLVFGGVSCGKDGGPRAGGGYARSYRMGFSAIPPSPDFPTALAALDLWTRRADAAILHVEPPWDTLLAGFPADSAVLIQHLPLVQYYRAKGLEVFVTLDATNGLDRSAESAALVALGRSITEPAVQEIYRAYAVAMDSILRPSTMMLAAETNLIRAAASPALYGALVQMANAAAADVRARDGTVRLGVSVQVEVAWGRLAGPGGAYVGIAQDLTDFPFMQAVGLSSYPYLAGFSDPEELPLDYYARLTTLPILVVEGGWSSETVASPTSPEEQARYLRRQATLLSRARSLALFQLTFTDLDPAYFPPGTILPLFASLGLVRIDLSPKPALATWDSTFARPRS